METPVEAKPKRVRKPKDKLENVEANDNIDVNAETNAEPANAESAKAEKPKRTRSAKKEKEKVENKEAEEAATPTEETVSQDE